MCPEHTKHSVNGVLVITIMTLSALKLLLGSMNRGQGTSRRHVAMTRCCPLFRPLLPKHKQMLADVPSLGASWEGRLRRMV